MGFLKNFNFCTNKLSPFMVSYEILIFVQTSYLPLNSADERYLPHRYLNEIIKLLNIYLVSSTHTN